MSSFTQWYTAFAKKPEPKQITWVCGSEPVLVEYIVSTIVRHISAPVATFVAGEDSERMIWEELDQHPIDNKPRLVIIRSADRLKKLERLITLVTERRDNPLTHYVFVSNSDKLERLPVAEEDRRSKKQGELVPHLASITGKGSLIECKAFTQATAKTAVEWVKSLVLIRDGVAQHLLSRSAWDLRLVRDVCVKLANFDEDITKNTVNVLLSEKPQDSFVNSLLEINKKHALLALQSLPEGDYSRTIGLLDSRLDLAGLVHDMLGSQAQRFEIMRAAGSQGFLVDSISHVAHNYSSQRILQLRSLMAIADEALQHGATVGVLETLVVFW